MPVTILSAKLHIEFSVWELFIQIGLPESPTLITRPKDDALKLDPRHQFTIHFFIPHVYFIYVKIYTFCFIIKNTTFLSSYRNTFTTNTISRHFYEWNTTIHLTDYLLLFVFDRLVFFF